VDGWDDPRMPTLVGARRRGYTPEGLRLFCDRIGVAKNDSWIDFTILEDCMREHLNAAAQRRIAVLDPVKLVIDNYPENQSEECFAPNHPQQPELGTRAVPFSRELWIDRDDFMETPSKGFFRLSPGAEVRLRYAYIVRCERIEHDSSGRVSVIHCTYDPQTKSGSTENRKVKGNIHWLCARTAQQAEVRIYDRLFKTENPGAGDRDFLLDLNAESKQSVSAWVETALAGCAAHSSFQFERHGYFVADRVDHRPGAPVFNRAVTLRDSWTAAAR
jgi:glutaminyl-tRNA synthetase